MPSIPTKPYKLEKYFITNSEDLVKKENLSPIEKEIQAAVTIF